MQLQIAAATWRLEARSDSAFYEITFVFVIVLLFFIHMWWWWWCYSS